MFRFIWSLIFIFCVPGFAFADGEPKQEQRQESTVDQPAATPIKAQPVSKGTAYGHWTTQLAARVNPVGLRLSNLGGWRIPLSSSEHILLKGTYLEFGGGMPVTPVSLFPTAYVEIVPIAPVVLRAQTRQMTFLGALGNVATFTQADIDAGPGNQYWNPKELESRRDGGEGVFAMGWNHLLSGTLQLKLGRFVAKGTFEYHWVHLDIPEGDVHWYDSTEDLVFTRNDNKLIGKGLLAYVASGELSGERFLLVGSTFDYQKAVNLENHRKATGLLVVWRPGLWAKRKLTFGTLVQYYVHDAGDHRTGQFSVAGFCQISFGGPPRR